ncbi:MAG: PP2C family serine/threonine-protein phosphatase [Candidatus Velthaea sp.]
MDHDAGVSWRYVDAFAVGLSHRENDTPCQDRCAGAVIASLDGGDVFVTVVSDGAGSAAHAERGAQIVCDVLATVVGEAVRASSDLDRIGDELVRSWFLCAREAVREEARALDGEIREYAATALLAVASDHQTLCARIGDGGIVLRRTPADAFEVALWPDSGEYANQTYFITDDAAAERIAIARFDDVSDVVAFSDGLQNLALEQATRTAFPPFFLPLVAAVRRARDTNGKLHAELVDYLNSPAINERTADDKSLVVGCRITPT